MLKFVGTDGRRYYSWNLEPGKFVIGRKPECDFCVADKTVSRKHAELRVESENGPFILVDLDSHNGTLVNGQRITAATEIKPGDHILFGSVEFKVSAVEKTEVPGMGKRSTAGIFTDVEPEKSVFLSINEALAPLPAKVTDRPEVMTTLFEMAKMLVIPEPKEVMLQRSLELVKEAVPAERLAVLLTAEDNDDLYVAVTYTGEKNKSGSFTLSKTIVKEILTNKNAVLVSNPEEDPRFASQESIIMSQLKSAMAVPLFAEDNVLGILYADTTKPGQQYNDDYLRLFATFGNLIAFRLMNYALLTELQEKQVMEAEIRRASVIQRNLLPKETPRVAGYAVHAFQEQCRSVGGDLYDVALLPDGRLLFLVADVSGKGMGAALLMSNILASFRILYHENFDLCQAVRQVSLQLYSSSAPNDFATLFVGILDEKSDTVSFVNAGHNPPLLVRNDGTIEYLQPSGTMIGAFSFSEWKEESVKFQPGDVLFVFSDGVTEAEREGSLYGDERTERLVVAHRGESPAVIAQKLLEDIKAFVKDSPRSDDITMLFIKKEESC